MFFLLYRWLVVVLAPFVVWHVHARARAGKEDPARLVERWGREELAMSPPAGFTAADRPLWVHAASVGEALSALAVIHLVQLQTHDLAVVFTTGTRTSAQMVAGRLPPRCVHRYAPYDHPVWVARFLDRWRPRAAVRIEAEIWPTTLSLLQARGIKTVMLNAHMSARSFSAWSWFPKTARQILSMMTFVQADGAVNAARYAGLLGRDVAVMPNLKFINAPLPDDENDRRRLQAAIGDRPVWLYASTHGGEEMIAADIHQALKSHIPNILTIVVPRHPDRTPEILEGLSTLNLVVTTQSNDVLPKENTDIFLIDRMGQLGVLYRLCPVAVIGRSFSKDGGGGHNPIEAAQLGCFPISGPSVHNVQTIFDAMIDVRAAVIVNDVQDLIAWLAEHLADPARLRDRGQAAQIATVSLGDQAYDALSGVLTPILQGGDRARP